MRPDIGLDLLPPASEFAIARGEQIVANASHPVCEEVEALFVTALGNEARYIRRLTNVPATVLVREMETETFSERVVVVRNMLLKVFCGNQNGIILDSGLLRGFVAHNCTHDPRNPDFLVGRPLFFPLMNDRDFLLQKVLEGLEPHVHKGAIYLSSRLWQEHWPESSSKYGLRSAVW